MKMDRSLLQRIVRQKTFKHIYNKFREPFYLGENECIQLLYLDDYWSLHYEYDDDIEDIYFIVEKNGHCKEIEVKKVWDRIRDIFNNNGKIMIARANGTMSIITKEFTTENRADGKSHCYETKDGIDVVIEDLMIVPFQTQAVEDGIIIVL